MPETNLPDGYTLTPALSEERQTNFKRAEEVLEPNKDYQAVIETNKGRLVVDLFQDEAPKTVNHFVFLALHHFYDGIVFHRVLENFMAQTGDPTGSGRGGPGYKFADEFSARKHGGAGVVSMANAGPNTNGSQFFITFRPTPHLDGRHAVFGKVTKGLEVLERLQRIDPARPVGIKPDVMERVYIVEK
jgi:peptidylprolyl isomerase/peptidyl-prolyl cis-trans isomerase B (cyclophilin B)